MPKQYRATKKSYGYQNRYWNEGEIATVSDKDKVVPPKELFEPIGAAVKSPVVPVRQPVLPAAKPVAAPVVAKPPLAKPK